MSPLLLAILVLVAAYAALLVALVVTGRRSRAVALLRLLPDLAIFLKRLARDPRVGRHHKAALLVLAAYLASPIDLVPDFIPVAGQLDDAVLVALVLRWVMRSRGRGVLLELWPGPAETRALLERLVLR